MNKPRIFIFASALAGLGVLIVLHAMSTREVNNSNLTDLPQVENANTVQIPPRIDTAPKRNWPQNPTQALENPNTLRSALRLNPISLINPEYYLSPEFKDVFRLSAEQAQSVSIAVRDVLEQGSALVTKNISIDAEKTSEKISAFRIKPFPKEGDALRQEFRSKTASIIGDEVDTFDKIFPYQFLFGEFGRMDVEIQFEAEPPDSPQPFFATYKEVDPGTGARRNYGTGTIEQMKRRYGSNFITSSN